MNQRRTRYAKWTLGLMACAAPLILFAAISALRSTSNDPRQWLPKSFDETDTYDWFGEHFGSDEIAVVSWPGCTIKDPRVPKVADAISASPYFDRVLTGPSVLADLTSPPSGMSRGSALRRLRGILVNPDTETTCLILSTSLAGQADRVEAIKQLEQIAASESGVLASELRLAGPTVDAAAIDIESRRLLFQLAGFSALLSFLVASFRMRSVRLAVIVLIVAVYSTGVALAILYLSGSKMNLLMTMLPPLIYVLSISSAVHLANYYRDSANTPRCQDPLRTAIAHGWLPCVLAATTTAIGLVSLVMSKIEPIQSFGLYSALGVISSMVVLFTMLPAALHLFPPKVESGATNESSAGTRSQQYMGWVNRHHWLLLMGCLAVMAFCGWGLPYVKSTVKLQDRFLPGSDAIEDYRWLESNIGPMVPLEVVIRFGKEDPRDTSQQLQVVARVQSKIHGSNESVATMSAVNLSSALPSGSSLREVMERKIINSPQTIQRLTDSHFIAETDGERLWRITVRAPAIGDLDYGQFAESLRQRIAPLLSEQNATGTFTGVIPLIYKAQRQLLQDLFRSFIAAFAVIGVVLVLVLRSVTAAMLAMIPNLFPAVVVFGGLEWIDIPIQIGSVMTASAALGIAVDDTVHFLTWFRRGVHQGLTRAAALEDAFNRCAGAMAHTTLICASGLLVFAASSFVPILHFAWLMVALLLSALVGDLVLLPSILAGPLGKRFETRTTD
ncbi:efflux RND transporter permease subunit [Novipirellula artificiosorum]|uniref:efflux RND transporter permease subunit n=1 Tax=Novipirellula artificiosorum TaxID=2528016 RepID=UPI0018CC8DC9|nr:MMPL family transporter [Novipirellula artificiosorum]